MSRCRHCAPVPEEVRQAAGLLEGRWTISILWASYEGASRFNEFKQAVGEIPPRTLALRLVELEEAGVLERRVVDARPPRVEYTLTDRGRRLLPIFQALERWGAEVLKGMGGSVQADHDGARALVQPLDCRVDGL
jgi:DNA-binding HxlR family transcriptional regulator